MAGLVLATLEGFPHRPVHQRPPGARRRGGAHLDARTPLSPRCGAPAASATPCAFGTARSTPSRVVRRSPARTSAGEAGPGTATLGCSGWPSPAYVLVRPTCEGAHAARLPRWRTVGGLHHILSIRNVKRNMGPGSCGLIRTHHTDGRAVGRQAVGRRRSLPRGLRRRRPSPVRWYSGNLNCVVYTTPARAHDPWDEKVPRKEDYSSSLSSKDRARRDDARAPRRFQRHIPSCSLPDQIRLEQSSFRSLARSLRFSRVSSGSELPTAQRDNLSSPTLLARKRRCGARRHRRDEAEMEAIGVGVRTATHQCEHHVPEITGAASRVPVRRAGELLHQHGFRGGGAGTPRPAARGPSPPAPAGELAQDTHVPLESRGWRGSRKRCAPCGTAQPEAQPR